jgi:NhaP-type Na+/H+ or K+/H+ antiporter
MVFVALGLVLGGWGLDWIDLPLKNPILDRLGELALVLVLFTDASRIDLACLRASASLPARLLAIGLPLTFLAGTLLAVALFPTFSIWEALVLAAILAPTDAALGQAVVSSPLVPQRVRQTLNVESGLNDGIALPVVLLAVSLAGMLGEGADPAYWLRFGVLQIGLAPIVGAFVGYAGGQVVERSSHAGWMNEPFRDLSALALAVLAYGGAELVGGNGFIAAFICGLTLGNTAPALCESVREFGEAEGQLLTLLVFMLFGAVIVPAVVRNLEVEHVLYALGSLTVVRMVPVALSLLGSGLMPASFGFIGWFGPRGLASILYMLIVVEEEHFFADSEIEAVVALTVLLSIFAHGLTAYPLAARYGAAVARIKGVSAQESRAAMDLPVRHPFKHGDVLSIKGNDL